VVAGSGAAVVAGSVPMTFIHSGFIRRRFPGKWGGETSTQYPLRLPSGQALTRTNCGIS
jgi:hypothetical protein